MIVEVKKLQTNNISMMGQGLQCWRKKRANQYLNIPLGHDRGGPYDRRWHVTFRF